jgi:hypothetical protein
VGESNSSPAHVIDGDLDSVSTLVASNGGIDLYADWDGDFLYVATAPVAATSNKDHFVVIGADLASPVASPWAKAGTVAGRALFMGNEDSNNWCGWFDESEALLSSGVDCAGGTYLEGTVRLADYLGDPLPAGLYLAMAAYDSPDGGALAVQAPSGNADANVDAGEYVYFPLDASGVPGKGSGDPEEGHTYDARLFAVAPCPTTGGATMTYHLTAATRVDLAVYDISGRRVATLGPAAPGAGYHAIEWDGCGTAGESLSPGLYFVVMNTPRDTQTRKLIVLR